MRRAVLALSLLSAAAMAQAQVTGNCASLAAPLALPIQPTVIAPIASEMIAPSHQLGAPTGVLANAFDEAQSVDQVLFRIRIEDCQRLASVTPVTMPGAMPTSTDPAAYKPQTEFDNTPWRFDMSQNGKQMTADEFTAWMNSKGVRVAKGAAKPAVVVTSAATPMFVAPGVVMPVVAPAPIEGAPATTVPVEPPPETANGGQ